MRPAALRQHTLTFLGWMFTHWVQPGFGKSIHAKNRVNETFYNGDWIYQAGKDVLRGVIQLHVSMVWAIMSTASGYWYPLDVLFLPIFLVFSPWLLLYGPFTFFVYRGLVFDRRNPYWLIPLHCLVTALYIGISWGFQEWSVLQWILLLPPAAMVCWHLLLIWPIRIYPTLLVLSDWVSTYRR